MSVCQIPVSEKGWAGHCTNEADWTAGWYMYRYGAAWTAQHRDWLVHEVTDKPSHVELSPHKVADVTHPPRGTAAKSNKPLPTEELRAGEITTSFPDGTKITAKSDNGSSIVILPNGHTITFQHASGIQIHTNPVTGEKETVHCVQNKSGGEGEKRCQRF